MLRFRVLAAGLALSALSSLVSAQTPVLMGTELPPPPAGFSRQVPRLVTISPNFDVDVNPELYVFSDILSNTTGEIGLASYDHRAYAFAPYVVIKAPIDTLDARATDLLPGTFQYSADGLVYDQLVLAQVSYSNGGMVAAVLPLQGTFNDPVDDSVMPLQDDDILPRGWVKPTSGPSPENPMFFGLRADPLEPRAIVGEHVLSSRQVDVISDLPVPPDTLSSDALSGYYDANGLGIIVGTVTPSSTPTKSYPAFWIQDAEGKWSVVVESAQAGSANAAHKAIRFPWWGAEESELLGQFAITGSLESSTGATRGAVWGLEESNSGTNLRLFDQFGVDAPGNTTAVEAVGKTLVQVESKSASTASGDATSYRLIPYTDQAFTTFTAPDGSRDVEVYSGRYFCDVDRNDVVDPGYSLIEGLEWAGEPPGDPNIVEIPGIVDSVTFPIPGGGDVIGVLIDPTVEVDGRRERLPMLAVPPRVCRADINLDGTFSRADIVAFIIAYTTDSPTADYTGDGMLNGADVKAFIAAIRTGC